MNLFFLRHGKAFERSPKFRPDSKRPLTREGEKKTREVARGIRELEEHFDLILTSPYIRALRTAEILADVLKSNKMSVTNNLAAEANPHALVDEINRSFSGRQNIVLVGHEPYLSGLISILLTGGPDLRMDFKKAGFCKLEVDHLRFEKCSFLAWLLTPG